MYCNEFLSSFSPTNKVDERNPKKDEVKYNKE
jgi:hypothetical protein